MARRTRVLLAGLGCELHMARVDLDLGALVQEACSSLRAGAKLDLRPQSDGTAICCTSGDQQVGTLTAQQVAGLPKPCSGTVRSVRQKGGQTSKVLVRFTPGGPSQAAPGAAHATLPTPQITCNASKLLASAGLKKSLRRVSHA